MYETAVEIISSTYISVFPIAFFVGMCDLIACTVLRAAFGGRLWFGK